MAVSLDAVGTIATASATTLAVTSPAGSIGDLLLFMVGHDDWSEGPITPSSPPITMNLIATMTPQYADDSRMVIYWAIEDQAAGRAFTFGTLGSAHRMSGVIFRFSGHDATAPYQAGSFRHVGGQQYASGTDADRYGDMFIGGYYMNAFLDNEATPSGWTNRVNHEIAGFSMHISSLLATQYPFPQAHQDLWMGEKNAFTGDGVGWMLTIAKDTTDTYTISGITKDNAGEVLGSCEVALFKEVGGTPPDYQFVESTTSNSTTGAYSFTLDENPAKFMVYAIKDDTPAVFDATDNVHQPT